MSTLIIFYGGGLTKITKVHIGTSKTGDIAYSPIMHSSWREGTLEITMIMLMIARASLLNEIKDLSIVLMS